MHNIRRTHQKMVSYNNRVCNSHLQLKPVWVVCLIQPPPDTKCSGLSYKDKNGPFKYDYVHYNMLFHYDICLKYMTYLMARHTSLWISGPMWSTGAMRSCHSRRPDLRTLSLFCSDWGLKNLKTTWGRRQTKQNTLKHNCFLSKTVYGSS